MACPPAIHWLSAAVTHVGRVREINEDTCLERPGRGLWAVADGMGGHALGDFASRRVAESLDALPAAASLDRMVAGARAQLQAANGELRAEAASRDLRIIGSTVAALLACERQCACLWAGDSRIYLYRGGRLVQLSRDHSQAEESRRQGEAADGLNRWARHLITRAVGAADSLELDQETLEVMDGDMFLLCSDGLTNAVGDEDLRAALVPGDCRQAAETLIALALEAGGRDNISAIVVRAEDLHSSDQTVVNPAL